MNIKVTRLGTQNETKDIPAIPARKPKILHYTVDYDSTKPVDIFRDFVSDVRGMVRRYDDNKARITEIEQEIVDLEHYMEIASFKNVAVGYRLYRKLTELRRERRACKNECDLLQPVYDYFHATDVLNRLTILQGDCVRAKDAIDNRTYMTRTDVLEPFLVPDRDVGAGQIIDLGSDLTEELAIEGL